MPSSRQCSSGGDGSPGYGTKVVYGFVRLGLTSEPERFVEFIEDRAHEVASDGSLQIMNGINGEHQLPEEELPPSYHPPTHVCCLPSMQP